jgi:hypothetical protein
MRFTVLIAIGCAMIGCDTQKPGAPAPTPPASSSPSAAPKATTASQPRHGWFQVQSGKASHILVTELTIPGVFKGKTKEIPLARYEKFDADGMMQFAPERVFAIENADGHNKKGGFGYGGGIGVFDDEDMEDAIILNVSYYWTTSDQVRGELKEKVRARIGIPLDVTLPGGCRLQVSWRVEGGEPKD